MSLGIGIKHFGRNVWRHLRAYVFIR